MHSPEVVVFHLKVPVPCAKWKRPEGRPRWAWARRRFGCPQVESPLCGEAIHPWWRPAAWQAVLAGREIGWTDVGTVWHYEPDGADSGETCKGMGGTEFLHNVRWAWEHRAHCEVHWRHYRKVHRWLFDRCDRCGKPFRGDYRAAVGTWVGEEHWHVHCDRINHLERQADVFARFIARGEDGLLARSWARSRADTFGIFGDWAAGRGEPPPRVAAFVDRASGNYPVQWLCVVGDGWTVERW